MTQVIFTPEQEEAARRERERVQELQRTLSPYEFKKRMWEERRAKMSERGVAAGRDPLPGVPYQESFSDPLNSRPEEFHQQFSRDFEKDHLRLNNRPTSGAIEDMPMVAFNSPQPPPTQTPAIFGQPSVADAHRLRYPEKHAPTPAGTSSKRPIANYIDQMRSNVRQLGIGQSLGGYQ